LVDGTGESKNSNFKRKEVNMNQKRLPIILLFIIALFIVTATNAFAAANTVPESKAGDGSGDVSGFTVSAVHYGLGANPTEIDSVTFTLDSEPVSGSTIKIRLVSSGSTWYTCTNDTTEVTCVTTGATVSPSNSLEVVVAQ
jgi:hypothetical protein